MKKLTIKQNEAGQRLDKFLQKYLYAAERSFIYKMLRKKNITLNGKRAEGSEKVSAGDSVELYLSDETIEKFSPPKKAAHTGVALSIVYEDDDFLFVNKPVGMLSQKAAEADLSLNEHILSYLLETGRVTQESLSRFRPSVCNRLDRNTSGLILAGKTPSGSRSLSAMLRARTPEKYYLSIVCGQVTKPGHVKGWLLKEELTNTARILSEPAPESSPIETVYEPLEQLGDFTLLGIRLITGKTHQIRAHLASEGYPVLGDAKYGNREINREFSRRYPLRHQLLHAWRITFPSGTSPEPAADRLMGKSFTAQPPVSFRRCLSLLGGELPC